ncbi:FAEB-1 [Sanghuangporus sanghuang]
MAGSGTGICRDCRGSSFIGLHLGYSQPFVALGNGGLNGCIDFDNLNTGSSKSFAAIASNNGHDSDTGEYFLNDTEVLADFTSRVVHTETLVGKPFVSTYYGQSTWDARREVDKDFMLPYITRKTSAASWPALQQRTSAI